MKDLGEVVYVADRAQVVKWRNCLAAAWLWLRRFILWLDAFTICWRCLVVGEGAVGDLADEVLVVDPARAFLWGQGLPAA